MSTVEPMADPQDDVEVPSSVDARTLQILERRRTSALRMRRGWLVRRYDFDEERTDHSTADGVVDVVHLGTGRSKVFLMGNGSI